MVQERGVRGVGLEHRKRVPVQPVRPGDRRLRRVDVGGVIADQAAGRRVEPVGGLQEDARDLVHVVAPRGVEEVVDLRHR